jgi:alpha-beta hydrolase superfamily lysophospholipase
MPHRIHGLAAWLVVACCLSACTSIDLYQRQHIFQPTAEIAGTPADFGFEFEEQWLPVQSAGAGNPQPQRLNAWWIPGPAPDACAILYLHGNGWNIGDSAYDTARLRRMGFAVLAVDYRGYGKSEGAFPSEVQVYEDAQVAWNHLATLQPNARRRFVYGHSLGGAIAIELATKNADIAGLVVEGSFTSIADMAKEVHGLGFLPLDRLVTQRFDSIAKIGRIAMPVLFIHGQADSVSPFSMSERLYAAAPEPKSLLLVPGAGHSSIAVVAWDRYRAAIRDFTARFGGC